MEYGLKYRKTYERDGRTFQLRLLKKNYTGGIKEIGNFTSLSLNMNESNAPIDEAIHTSTLTFAMVNAEDMQDTATVKYSGWEEFYTSDATEWKAVLVMESLDPDEGPEMIWAGFVTPDSWDGDLQYHAEVVITARDGLNTMKDIQFSRSALTTTATGDMVPVQDIIASSIYQASTEMMVDWDGTHWLKYRNQDMRQWCLDTRSMEGKDLYEIVENICVSLGLCIRFGWGKFSIRTMRDLSEPADDETTRKERDGQFINRSGHYSLNTPYKSIQEVDELEVPDAECDTFPSTMWRAVFGDEDMPEYNASFGDEVGGNEKYRFVRVTDITETNHPIERHFNVANRTKFAISFEMAHYHRVYDSGEVMNMSALPYKVKIHYEVRWTNGTSVYNWDFENQEWVDQGVGAVAQSGDGATSMTIDLEVTTPDMPGDLALAIWMNKTDLYPEDPETGQLEDDFLAYTRMGQVKVEIKSESYPAKLKATTNYDEKYNLVLKREAKYVPCPTWLQTSGGVLNGIYLNLPGEYYPPVKSCTWTDTTTALPIPVQVHMQIIAHHAKPNYVLTGDLRDKSGETPDCKSIWKMYDRKFLLIAGNYNVLDGFIYSACLVEYDSWEDVCGGMTADYEMKNSEYKTTGGSSSASSVESSGGGGGGGITITQLQAYLTNNHYYNSSNLESSDIITSLGYTPANQATTYTKTQTDTALGNKADKASTYTKTEINVLVPKVYSIHLTQDEDGDFVGPSFADVKAKYDAGYTILLENDGTVYLLSSYDVRTEGGVLYGKFTFCYVYSPQKLLITAVLDQKTGWAYGTDTTLLDEATIIAKGYLKKADADRYYAGKAHQSVMVTFEEDTYFNIWNYISDGWNVVVRSSNGFYHLSELDNSAGVITWTRFANDDSHWRVTLNENDQWDEEGGL